jgi:small-conductance mechanosensitive channel
MVTIGGVTGVVVDTTILLTRIRTIKNEVVTVPNASVFSGQLTNYSAKSRADGLILHTTITIGYDAPWRKVHDLLIAAALRTDRVLREPPPFVRQESLNDYHISYEINAYTRDAAEMFSTYSQLHENIHDTFDEGGIEILSPAYTNLRDGNADTIPAIAPATRAFRLRVDTPEVPEEAQTAG